MFSHQNKARLPYWKNDSGEALAWQNGWHGYDNEFLDMRGFFLATGPGTKCILYKHCIFQLLVLVKQGAPMEWCSLISHLLVKVNCTKTFNCAIKMYILLLCQYNI